MKKNEVGGLKLPARKQWHSISNFDCGSTKMVLKLWDGYKFGSEFPIHIII